MASARELHAGWVLANGRVGGNGGPAGTLGVEVSWLFILHRHRLYPCDTLSVISISWTRMRTESGNDLIPARSACGMAVRGRLAEHASRAGRLQGHLAIRLTQTFAFDAANSAN